MSDKLKKAEEFKNRNANEKKVEERTVDGKTEYLDDVSNTWVSKGELKKLSKKRQTE